jgi:hypothetical protein
VSKKSFIPQGYPMLIAKTDGFGRPLNLGTLVIGWRTEPERTEIVAVLVDGTEVGTTLIRDGLFAAVLPSAVLPSAVLPSAAMR